MSDTILQTSSVEAPSKRPVRIFVAEPHPILRRGLISFVSEQAELALCGESPTLETVTDQVREADADLVLVSTSAADWDGSGIIGQLRSGGYTGQILILADRESAGGAETALRSGANGYLSQDSPSVRLMEAIRTVLNHEVYLPSELISPLLNRLVTPDSKAGPAAAIDELTRREKEVLALIGAGLKTQEIADRLNLSPKTVDVHRGNIKHKLEIQSVNELIRFAVTALDRGLLEPA